MLPAPWDAIGPSSPTSSSLNISCRQHRPGVMRHQGATCRSCGAGRHAHDERLRRNPFRAGALGILMKECARKDLYGDSPVLIGALYVMIRSHPRCCSSIFAGRAISPNHRSKRLSDRELEVFH